MELNSSPSSFVRIHQLEAAFLQLRANAGNSYMGDDFKYRSADGSNNNPTLPWLGAANTAYCRTIPPLTIQPSGLPDAGLIFDTLFARQEFTPHPNKVSSVFFDWASLIIHGNSALLKIDIHTLMR